MSALEAVIDHIRTELANLHKQAGFGCFLGGGVAFGGVEAVSGHIRSELANLHKQAGGGFETRGLGRVGERGSGCQGAVSGHIRSELADLHKQLGAGGGLGGEVCRFRHPLNDLAPPQTLPLLKPSPLKSLQEYPLSPSQKIAPHPKTALPPTSKHHRPQNTIALPKMSTPPGGVHPGDLWPRGRAAGADLRTHRGAGPNHVRGTGGGGLFGGGLLGGCFRGLFWGGCFWGELDPATFEVQTWGGF